MANEWKYQKGDQTHESISSTELKSLVKSGVITPDTLVCKEGMTKWIKASQVKGLFPETPAGNSPALPASPQPPAPAAPTPTPVRATAVAPPPLPTSTSTSTAPVRAAAVAPPPLPTSTSTSTTQQAADKVRSVFGKFKESVSGAVNDLQASRKTSSGTPSVPSGDTSLPAVKAEQSATSTEAEVATPPRLPTDVSTADVIIQCRVAYRGGHPQQTDDGTGILYLAQSGVYYVDTVPEHDISFAYAQVGDILAPIPGSFSPEMIAKSKRAQNLSVATKNLGRLAGGFMGGTEGQLLRAASSTASGAAADQAKMGALPKNRLAVVYLEGTTRHKILFDVMAPSTEEMEQQASQFIRRVASVRARFHSPASRSSSGGGRPLQPLPSGPAERGSASGHGFFVMRNGSVNGPYTDAMLRAMMANGELTPTDCVRLEMWLPVAALGLFGSAVGSSSLPASHGTGLGHSDGGATLPHPAPPARSGHSVLPVAAAAAGGVVAGAAAAVLLSSGGHAGANPGHSIHDDAGVQTLDTNGDGIPDAIGMDTNQDGQIDTVGMDTDYDGNIDTVGMDTDYDGNIDTVGMDTDYDGDIDTACSEYDDSGDDGGDFEF